MFTDIEGSTKLLQTEGDRYADLLAEHRRILRDAFAARGGVEVDTQGDAFFVAFARATDGVLAAQHAQAELASGPIRVRMGLHTGEPLLTEEGYVGLDVHKGARIAAAGHGGQVLLSEATRQLVEADVKDLGLHRLKDLQAAERIFQLGQTEFPPLKSLNQTNLPVQPTPFLGREAELKQVAGLLAREDVRLLTLTGPGGTGKTRLALQAAAEVVEEFPGGVSFVALASLADPALLIGAITTTLGLRESADATSQEVLLRHIGSRRTLLLLDNVEQLLPAAAQTIAGLNASAPGLTIAITSREPLRLAGEVDYPVAPLARDDAVALFVRRAQSVVPSFEATEDRRTIVETICARLDYLPLALELAAARLRILTVRDLLDRLERRLPLLTGGARDAPERQRTLQAAIAWSYDLLSEDEQRLFAHLSVFTGGASLDAASAVCGADIDAIESLVEKSLVRRVEGAGDEARVAMLETIREFASNQLDKRADADEVRRVHAGYFLTAAERAEPLLQGRDQMKWLDRIENDHDNVRGALEWLLDNDPPAALRLAAALWLFWYMHGHVTEGRRWLGIALEKAGPVPSDARANALDGAGYLAGEQSDAGARALLEEALRCAREVGSPSTIAIVASHLSVHMDIEEGEQARALGEEAVALSRAANDGYALGVALNNLAQVWLYRLDDPERALELTEESLAVRREIGDVSRTALTLSNLSSMVLERGDVERARALGEEGLSLARGIGDKRHICFSLLNIGLAALARGEAQDAEIVFRESLALANELGRSQTSVEILDALAGSAAEAGDVARAARLTGAVAALVSDVSREVDLSSIALHAVERARATADPSTWDAAWSEGEKMSLDDAIAYALSDTR